MRSNSWSGLLAISLIGALVGYTPLLPQTIVVGGAAGSTETTQGTNAFGKVVWPGEYYPEQATSSAGVIDAASEKYAGIFQAPLTGNITKIYFMTSTVTTGATVDVRLETVDATNGDPTGTLVATNTNAAVVVDAADDNVKKTATLTAAAAVTAGSIYAVVVVNPAASFGNMVIASHQVSAIAGNFPYSDLFTTIWTKSARYLAAAVEYDTTAKYNIGTGLITQCANTTITNATTPDEVGIIFQSPVPITLYGVRWFQSGAIAASGSTDIVLYDSDGSSVLRSATLDSDIGLRASSASVAVMFPTEVLLSAATNYRLVLKPTTANTINYLNCRVVANTDWALVDGGITMYRTERTDAGAWTQTDTQRPNLRLIVSKF
jgi:hypothetical protein